MPNGPKKMTLKEISRLAGVSVATVSRVVNNNGRFSEETRKVVNGAIKKYNYIPSAVARGLRTNKIKNIGVIVPDIINEFFARLTLIVQKKLFRHGYSTLIYNTDEIDEIEQKHISDLIAQNVSGIIYIAGGYSEEEHMPVINVPTVYLDRRPKFLQKQDNYAIIESDNFQGGYLAANELIQAKCKNPIILMDKRKLVTQMRRLEGYKAALDEGKIPFCENRILYVDKIEYTSGYQEIEKYLDAGKTTDGVFGTTDWLALGAVRCMSDRGYKLPEQVKVVGFDDISIAAFSLKPLTTIKQDTEAMGGLAAEMIMKMIEGVQFTEKNAVLPVSLIKRETT